MNALAGWGFRTPEVLERHLNPPAPMQERGRKFKQGTWVGQEQIESYADTLTEAPTIAQVRAHFSCAYESGRRYRMRVLDVLQKRKGIA